MAVQETQPLFGASVNEVNINLEGTTREGMRAQDIARSKGDAIDFGGLMGGVAQLSASMKQAEDTSEANNAKKDYLNIVTSEGYLVADGPLKAEMLEGVIGTLHERPEAYANAFQGYSASEYSRQFDARSKVEADSAANAAPAAYEAWKGGDSGVPYVEGDVNLNNEQAGKTPEDFINEYAANNPTWSKGMIKTALMTDVIGQNTLDLQTATNEKELTDAVANSKERLVPFQNPMFMQTKDTKGKELVSAANRDFAGMIKLKQNEFKAAHHTELGKAVDNGYRMPPSQANEHINATAKNDQAAAKQRATYFEKYEERIVADTYQVNNPIGDRTTGLPDNAMIKGERQLMVTDSLQGSYISGNFSELVRVASNETGQTKEFGEMIVADFNNAESTEQISAIMTKVNIIGGQDKGATVLKQMLGDDEYVSMLAINGIATARPDLTLGQVKQMVDQAAGQESTVKLDPKVTMEMNKLAVKAGPQGAAYLKAMDVFRKLNPKQAEAEYKTLAKRFIDSVGEDSEGITVDNSIATLTDTLDPTLTDEMINKLSTQDYTSKYMLSPDVVAFRDDWGATWDVRDVKNTITESDRKTTLKAEIKSLQEPTFLETSGNVTQDMVQGLTKGAMGFFPILGELGGNITDAIKGNIIRNMSKPERAIFGVAEFDPEKFDVDGAFIDPKMSDDFDEMLLESLRQESDSLATELPNTIQINTMQPNMQDTLAASLEWNKAQKKKLEPVIEELENKIIEKAIPEAEEDVPVPKEPKKAPIVEEPKVRILPNVTSKFEGKIGTVSTGKGDLGGVSYGKHQMASGEGTVQGFVKSMYSKEFKGLEVNSKEYKAKWEELAINNPEKFEADQDEYIYNTLQKPVIDKLNKTGLDIYTQPEAIQGLLNSLTVQHGGDASDMFKKAMGKVGKNTQLGSDFVVKVFDQRMGAIPKGQKYKKRDGSVHTSDGTILRKFRSSSKAVQNGVRNRFLRERQLFLDMLK